MTTPRRPGRPRLDDHDSTVEVNVKMPGKLFDAACRLAVRQRVNFAEAIRRAIRRDTRESEPDER